MGGLAIKGNLDVNDELLPVRLSVDRWDEPNVANHQKSVNLVGTLSASGLTAGESYLLLRYESASAVPNSGFASASSQGVAQKVEQFIAEGATWTHTDPLGIPSGGSAFYRLVHDSAGMNNSLIV